VERAKLGAFGVEISTLGFGCGGLMQSPSRKERMALLATSVENGITHFDTARMYGLGTAEKELGEFLRTVRRDSVTIGTKFGIEAAGNARLLARVQRPARALLRSVPAIRKAVKRRDSAFATPRSYRASDAARSLDESLRALNTDYVDIFFLHAPRSIDDIDRDGLTEFFEDAREKGKIRAWGASQDEDVDTDIAARFGPNSVGQILCNAISPPNRPVDIAFGVLNEPYAALTEKLTADPGLLNRWRETLGVDPLAPGVLARLILSSAREITNSQAVLYSTTKPKRVAEAATAFADAVDSDIQGRFAVLAQEFGKGR
jgi:D-threo-aldose 1-dehydrogenase